MFIREEALLILLLEFGTYPNKIRREAIRFGIKPREERARLKENALKVRQA
jgi:hypothetical protein